MAAVAAVRDVVRVALVTGDELLVKIETTTQDGCKNAIDAIRQITGVTCVVTIPSLPADDFQRPIYATLQDVENATFVFVNCQGGLVNEVVANLHEVDGVVAAVRLVSEHDLLVEVTGANLGKVAEAVRRVQSINGVRATRAAKILRMLPEVTESV
jgi:DNA-binding Lrp family transcriptional regulator